jgi:BirA family biotin operon repressor/biotin-[acetyl-CoA-carboxylase] ligase
MNEIDSTNSQLIRMLRSENLPEGSAVFSLSQNEGRGQSGTVWESDPAKNILASFVFYPLFLPPRHVFDLNKTFALGVFDYVSEVLKLNVSIKWPNDIYYKSSKVAGLLIENAMTSSQLTYSVLGTGINVNQSDFSDRIPNAISLARIKGKELILEEEFSRLCSFIECRYLQLKRGDIFGINADYHSVLFRAGEWNYFEAASEKFKACIRNVNDNGRLVLETNDGETREFETKEIRFII